MHGNAWRILGDGLWLKSSGCLFPGKLFLHISDSWETKHVNPQCVPGERVRGINITISTLISLLSDFYPNFTSLFRVPGTWPGSLSSLVLAEVLVICRSEGSTSASQGCAGWLRSLESSDLLPCNAAEGPGMPLCLPDRSPPRQKPAETAAPPGFLVVPASTQSRRDPKDKTKESKSKYKNQPLLALQSFCTAGCSWAGLLPRLQLDICSCPLHLRTEP